MFVCRKKNSTTHPKGKKEGCLNFCLDLFLFLCAQSLNFVRHALTGLIKGMVTRQVCRSKISGQNSDSFWHLNFFLALELHKILGGLRLLSRNALGCACSTRLRRFAPRVHFNRYNGSFLVCCALVIFLRHRPEYWLRISVGAICRLRHVVHACKDNFKF